MSGLIKLNMLFKKLIAIIFQDDIPYTIEAFCFFQFFTTPYTL